LTVGEKVRSIRSRTIRRRGALSHQFDGGETATDAHDELTLAGGDRHPDPWFDVEPVPDDRGITHPAGSLEWQPTGGAGAGKFPIRTNRQGSNGVVVTPSLLRVRGRPGAPA
jgi:hypothetical protein